MNELVQASHDEQMEACRRDFFTCWRNTLRLLAYELIKSMDPSMEAMVQHIAWTAYMLGKKTNNP